MQITSFKHWLIAGFLSGAASIASFAPIAAHAQDLAPEAMVEKITNEALTEIQGNQKVKEGDIQAINDAVDRIVMPNINFQKMTAAAVGPAWRKATPTQREQLQAAFKNRLIRTYAGALKQAGNYKVHILPQRRQAKDADDVLVRSEIVGGNQPNPVQLDYRLQKSPNQGYGWKVYNVSIMGAWIVDTYRTQFTQEINAHGIDGLIKALNQNQLAQ